LISARQPFGANRCEPGDDVRIRTGRIDVHRPAGAVVDDQDRRVAPRFQRPLDGQGDDRRSAGAEAPVAGEAGVVVADVENRMSSQCLLGGNITRVYSEVNNTRV
jgi:hypothetical protein